MKRFFSLSSINSCRRFPNTGDVVRITIGAVPAERICGNSEELEDAG